MIVLDVMKPLTHKRIIERELEGFGIRLNKKKPDIYLKKKDKGGVSIVKSHGLQMTNMTEDTIRSILHEYRISNCEVRFK